MRLYELKHGDLFNLVEQPKVPPGSVEPMLEGVYVMRGLDGMYVKVDDQGGNRHYFAAWTDVERIKK